MPRFHITAWPGSLDLPVEVAFPPEIRWTEDAAWTPETDERKWLCYDLPQEFYLRQVHDVKLDERDSLREFVTEWGFFLTYWEPRHFEPDFWDVPHDLPYEEVAEPIVSLFEERFWHQRVSVEEQLREANAVVPVKRNDYSRRLKPYEWLEETRLGLTFIRDVARLAEAYANSAFRRLPSEWELAGYEVPAPSTPREAAAFLMAAVNNALSPLSAHLYVQEEEGYGKFASPCVASLVQVFNDVAKDVAYRRCANETCRRWFVHQVEGISEYGQYRSEGVLYCSNRCARAQAQREYRRRKKQI